MNEHNNLRKRRINGKVYRIGFVVGEDAVHCRVFDEGYRLLSMGSCYCGRGDDFDEAKGRYGAMLRALYGASIELVENPRYTLGLGGQPFIVDLTHHPVLQAARGADAT